jgi:N-acetyl-gamma-glutamyl-phosphate reductase
MTVLTTTSPAIATAGIAGSSGYAGRELHRLLASHPRLAAAACTADTRALVESDIVFLALPHGASGEIASELASARVPVVDLSADLRAEWQYGLPELHRVAIAKSGAVANPGCYATAALLALAPLVEPARSSHTSSWTASRRLRRRKKPTDANLLPLREGIAPYSAVGHHHQFEIEQQLSAIAGAPQSCRSRLTWRRSRAGCW